MKGFGLNVVVLVWHIPD